MLYIICENVFIKVYRCTAEDKPNWREYGIFGSLPRKITEFNGRHMIGVQRQTPSLVQVAHSFAQFT